VRAGVRIEPGDDPPDVGLHRLRAEADAVRHLLGVAPRRKELQDLPFSLAELLLHEPGLGHDERGRERRIDEGTAIDDCANGPQQVLGRGSLENVPARARGDRVLEKAAVTVRGEHDEVHLGRGLVNAPGERDAVDSREAHVDDHDLRPEPGHRLERVLACCDRADELEVVDLAEENVEPLPHDRVVVYAEASRLGARHEQTVPHRGKRDSRALGRAYDPPGQGPGLEGDRLFASIVVGTDGSETATEAVRQAAELAKSLGAKIFLVSAYEPVGNQRLREERQQVPDDLQWMVNPREDVDTTLKDAATGMQEEGVDVETFAREGDPADAILDVAEERGADLIVVGNKGMTGAKRFLLGSVPNKVSHHAPCSVMIIRTT
jgi:nucleotide-binding universal stress UspA family protein